MINWIVTIVVIAMGVIVIVGSVITQTFQYIPFAIFDLILGGILFTGCSAPVINKYLGKFLSKAQTSGEKS